MKGMIKFTLILASALLLFTGCGASNESNSAKEDSKTKLSKTEKLALEFINVMFNESDQKVKDDFIEKNVYEDVKLLYQMGAATNEGSTGEPQFLNPVVQTSKKNETEEEKSEIVLITGTDPNGVEKKDIVLLVDGKIGLLYTSDMDDPEMLKMYNDLLAELE